MLVVELPRGMLTADATEGRKSLRGKRSKRNCQGCSYMRKAIAELNCQGVAAKTTNS